MFPSLSDAWLGRVLKLCAGMTGALVLLILVFLVTESAPALSAIGITRFFTDPSWSPTPVAAEGSFNMVPMMAGTFWTSLVAMILAGPAGIGSAIYCHFYASPKVARLYQKLIELLAGIPSVVYGFWGLTALVPFLAKIEPPGASLLAGALILSVMILPTIALVSHAAFAGVPTELTRGAAALGMSRLHTIRHVVIPASKSGLFTGLLLGVGRALGETMAVLMVCGNVAQHPEGLFSPVRTLTANIALEMAYAMDDHRNALFISGLLLMTMVTGLVVAAEYAGRRRIYD